MGYENLLSFKEKWGKKYPLTAKSRLDNWTNFSTSLSTRNRFARLYTRRIRSRECIVRYEKSLNLKELFSSEQALMKLMHLIYTPAQHKTKI